MLKKGLPLIFMSALLLGACSMNDNALPRTDETPMEGIEDRERNWTPDATDERRGGDDERRGGADFDGYETDDRMNEGLMNDDGSFEKDEAPMDNEKGDRNTNENDR